MYDVTPLMPAVFADLLYPQRSATLGNVDVMLPYVALCLLTLPDVAGRKWLLHFHAWKSLTTSPTFMGVASYRHMPLLGVATLLGVASHCQGLLGII